MNMFRWEPAVIFVLLHAGHIRCALKTWSVNTNYDNINNWDLKRIPCGRDRAIFPADTDVPVYMSKSTNVKELILPNNGFLIFPNDGSLVIAGDVSTQSCPGNDITFIGGQRKDYWFNPRNWNITSPLAVNLAGDKDLSPVPHSDQVPCEGDDVIFPTGSSYKVYFDGGSLKVGSLSINGKVYGTEDFASLVASDIGKAMYADPPSVTITTTTCSLESGCSCGNDKAQVMSKICSLVAANCPELLCSDPIRVTGNCCPICGTSLIMKYKEGFKMDTLTQLYTSYIKKLQYKSVQGYLSKTSEDTIQMVFVDASKTKGLAHRLATDIEGYIKQDIEDRQIYSVVSALLRSTLHWRKKGDHSPYSGGTSAGTGIGIFLGVLLAVGLLVVLYFVYRKRRIPGFSFARFDSGRSKIEMELGTTPHDVLDPMASASSAEPASEAKGFDNPMYEKPSFSLKNPSYKELKEREDKKKRADYRENPAYMVLDDGDE